MKLSVFLLLLLLAFLIAPARHHTRVRPGWAQPLVRVLRSPQAPKVVRRVVRRGHHPRNANPVAQPL